MYGWARVPGIQSLPRELTYDPLLQQICYNPPRELMSLRQHPPLLNLTVPTTVQPGMANSLSLGNWSTGSLGNSSEVWARFKIPKQNTLGTTTNVTFGVGIMTADLAPHLPSRLAFVEFQPPSTTIAATTTVYNVTVGVRSPLVLDGASPSAGGSGGGIVDSLQLTSEDDEIDLRVFFDGHFSEIFFMNGRVAMTVGIQATKSSGFTIFVEGTEAVEVSGAEAWHMGSIWVPKTELL